MRHLVYDKIEWLRGLENKFVDEIKKKKLLKKTKK